MPGSPVLLGSSATRVIPWFTGVLSSCHPSGGVSLVLQNLVWGSVELFRTSDGRVFCLIARLVLASASPWRFGYSMFGFSVALLPGAGGVSFAFVMVVTCSGTSLAPRLAGFTVPARPTRDKSQWENVISCGGGQVFLVHLGRRIVGGACRSFCHRL